MDNKLAIKKTRTKSGKKLKGQLAIFNWRIKLRKKKYKKTKNKKLAIKRINIKFKMTIEWGDNT